MVKQKPKNLFLWLVALLFLCTALASVTAAAVKLF